MTYHAGSQPLPVQLVAQVLSAAATDLTQSLGAEHAPANRVKPIDQQLYEATFDKFLPQLKGASNDTIQQAFGEALYFTMLQATASGNLSPTLVPSLLVLAHSAGFDKAATVGFQLVSFLAALFA